MPWFKVDDTLAMHPKVVVAGNAAMGLWVRAGSWSSQQLTEGRIPRAMLSVLGARPRDAAALVAAGLWVETDDGWAFHQWADRQPSRQQVEAERAAAAERQRRARERAKEQREAERQARESRAKSRRDKSVSHGPPDPTRPDPTKEHKPPADTAAAASPGAQQLIAHWIDLCGAARPDERTKGHVAREVGRLVAEGVPVEAIREGLELWHARRLNPATLASVVHGVRLGPPAPAARPSTTDQRVADGLALAARYAETDLAQPAIGGAP